MGSDLSSVGELAGPLAGTVVVFGAALASLASLWPRPETMGAAIPTEARSDDCAQRTLDALPAYVVTLGTSGAVTHANRAATERGGPGATALQGLFPDAAAEAIERLESLVSAASTTRRKQTISAAPLALFKQIGMFTVHAVPVVPPSADAAVVLFVTEFGASGDHEHQLLRVEKLATVGVLAAGIAHEVGTPLGVIRGRAEMVGRSFAKGTPNAENVNVIIEQIDRITRTIRALLDFARPRRVTACDLAVGRPIARVAELVRFEVEKRSLTLQVDVPSGLPLIHAESDKIEQILVNLVMNSIDATPAGGRITVTAARVGDERIAIRVRDTGAGIPSANLHQVFDPFFTTKALQRGTGLGLAIVDQIVRDHGGVVNLTSTVGRGTTVEVILPAATDED